MVDDRPIRRAKMREKFAELKRAAIADLERRGYDVRGKTPAQIRLILKRRPAKQTSDAKGALRATSLPKIRHDRQTTGVVGMAVGLCAASATFAFVLIGAVDALVRADRRYAHCPHLLSALSAE